MGLFTPADARFAQAIGDLIYCNPFLPQRIECERAALGDEFDDKAIVWNIDPGQELEHPNVVRICRKTTEVLDRARQKIESGHKLSDADRAIYEDLVLCELYHRFRTGFDRVIHDAATARSTRRKMGMYDQFASEAQQYLSAGKMESPSPALIAHGFACFFQIRRAYYHIFSNIIGISKPAIALRAAVWQSIFTHDMRRYRRSLFDKMADYATLITGPSGTGKELVARAVGLSRYIPFDPERQQFAEDFAGSFFALNLSAMSPTLIESELFGHKRGAFTGAVADRVGWMEVCPPLGTVFLDEIGELDASIQVKLLRVLQSRSFHRLGETEARHFAGKIISATNRDLSRQMSSGRFREDFFYRLCSDVIETPSLAARLKDEPRELPTLILHLAQRIAGPEAEPLATEVQNWIEQHLGLDYAWPGNVRELEQCVRNVMIRKEYHPPKITDQSIGDDPKSQLAAAVVEGQLTADELLSRYCTLVYASSGSYEQAARQLKLDRRTVKSRVDPDMLAKIT